MRPEVRLVEAEDFGDGAPVAWVGQAAGEPAADGLGVDADLFGEVVHVKVCLVENLPEDFTHGLTSYGTCVFRPR